MSATETIHILVIDDSVLVRKYLAQVLEGLTNIEIVGTAPNGKIGLQKIFLYKPDLVILDVEMPEMNGLEVLRYIKDNMPEAERPEVIMFSSLTSSNSRETFEALSSGAADFIKKPEGQIYDNIDFLKKEFTLKIQELYKSRLEHIGLIESVTKKEKPAARPEPEDAAGRGDTLERFELLLSSKRIRPELIAVGSSTGGPNAIRRIFDKMEQYPVPMVIAQHMPGGFTSEFAKNLSSLYKRDVIEARDGMVLENGKIYICPGGYHARIIKDDRGLVHRQDNGVYEGFFFKPSVDIFFRSIHQAVGGNVIALVLSGMGRDGSTDSITLRKSGALTIAQDRESSVVWGMPGSSFKSGGIDIVLKLDDIGTALNKAVNRLCLQ